jgi:hypothetical protein
MTEPVASQGFTRDMQDAGYGFRELFFPDVG